MHVVRSSVPRQSGSGQQVTLALDLAALRRREAVSDNKVFALLILGRDGHRRSAWARVRRARRRLRVKGEFAMTPSDVCITRRSAFVVLAGLSVAPGPTALAAGESVVTVHKDPNCGCCSRWVQHLRWTGFTVRTIETTQLDAVKARLGVPPDLAACHTAEVAGYVVEGHVPAAALKRFLTEKPSATGLAVPGMPVGSPGMEGGSPEPYEVILFGKGERRTYMRFVGDREV